MESGKKHLDFRGLSGISILLSTLHILRCFIEGTIDEEGDIA